jgi:nicotinamide-nucleotide amidase
VNVEIINTGTELLLGDIVNTSFQLLSRTLNDAGFNVLYQTTIGDNGERLLEALDIAIHRADIVITTGGLGPTRGDITKEKVAEYLHLPLVLSDKWIAKMQDFFKVRGIAMSENNKKQAMVPEGSVVFNNEVGTAPGLAVWTPDKKLIVMLPGPPAETKFVFEEDVMPYLRKVFAAQGIIHSRVLHLRGITESQTAEKLDAVVMAQTNPTVAIYARKGEIIIRITAKASSLEECQSMIAKEEALIRSCVGDYIYGVDYETLAEALGKRLRAKGLTIAFAESCTGGLTSSYITDIPGSSEYLVGSVVSYTNQVKHEVLGVPQETLNKYTAVSEETARAMAEGVRRLMRTDVGVSITGIAGPGGGTPEKPVGLVYEACATKNGTVVQKLRYKASRTTIKMRAAMNAMSMAMDEVKKL